MQNCWGGEQGGSSVQEDTGIVVATFERANTLINKMLEDDQLTSLSCVVVDELHMVCFTL